MTTATDVRFSLITSEHWTKLMSGLSVLSISRVPAMRIDDWAEDQRAAAVRWAEGEQTFAPDVIADYVQTVRAEA